MVLTPSRQSTNNGKQTKHMNTTHDDRQIAECGGELMVSCAPSLSPSFCHKPLSLALTNSLLLPAVIYWVWLVAHVSSSIGVGLDDPPLGCGMGSMVSTPTLKVVTFSTSSLSPAAAIADARALCRAFPGSLSPPSLGARLSNPLPQWVTSILACLYAHEPALHCHPSVSTAQSAWSARSSQSGLPPGYSSVLSPPAAFSASPVPPTSYSPDPFRRVCFSLLDSKPMRSYLPILQLVAIACAVSSSCATVAQLLRRTGDSEDCALYVVWVAATLSYWRAYSPTSCCSCLCLLLLRAPSACCGCRSSSKAKRPHSATHYRVPTS
eukprot:6459124-Amphidinium_carterae.1